MTRIVKSTPQTKTVQSNITPKVVSTKIRGVDVDTSRFKYNQSPDETPDGATTVFTVPNSDDYVSGLLEVFVNGNQKIKDTEWEETGTTQITLLGDLATNPPTSDEVIKCNYIKQ